MIRRTGTFFSIFLVYFLDYFGYALVFGVFGPLILDPAHKMFNPGTSMEVKNIALGILFAAFPFARFFGAPIFGDIADLLGRKKTFYFSISIGTMGYFISGLAIYFHSYSLLLLGRLVTGFFSGNQSTCLASIADLSPDEKSRSKNYGIIATLGGVSWVISMIVGGVFSNVSLHPNFNPAIPFWITTFLSMISLWAIHRFFTETHKGAKGFKVDLLKGVRHIALCFRIKELRILYTFYLFLMIGWGINLLWLNPYVISCYKISHTQLITLLASTGVVWSFGSSVVNKLCLKKFSSRDITRIGSYGLIAIFTLCAVSHTFYTFAIVALLASLFGALAWTNALSTISLAANEQIQGKAMGLSQSVGSISFLLAPLIAGFAFSINNALVYLIAAGFVLISLIPYALAKKTALLSTEKS